MFDKHDGQLSSAVNDRARYLLFTSAWTVIGSIILMLFFLRSADAGILTSVIVHIV